VTLVVALTLGLLSAAPADAWLGHVDTIVTPDGKCWMDIDAGTYAGVAYTKAHVNLTVKGNSCDRFQSYVEIESYSGIGPRCNLDFQVVARSVSDGAKCVRLSFNGSNTDFWSQTQVDGPIYIADINACSTAGSCKIASYQSNPI
jgi:hypothetical protein